MAIWFSDCRAAEQRPAEQMKHRDRHCDAEAILDPADRDFRIDLFRDLSLWWIFLDHVPETYLNHFTPKNFGFSDAAEILVFLSGLASGSVYGSVARQSGLGAASLRELRRCGGCGAHSKSTSHTSSRLFCS